MSKREHLLEFRADFEGPIRFKRGDTLWTKVQSRVVQLREFFQVQVLPGHPGYEQAAEAYGEAFPDNGQWDGRFVIPCSFVRFSEKEEELRLKRANPT